MEYNSREVKSVYMCTEDGNGAPEYKGAWL